MKWRAMRRPRMTTLAGVAAILAGGFWVVECVKGVYEVHAAGNDGATVFYYGLLMLALATPGVLSAYSGLRSLRDPSERAIKRTSGYLAAILLFCAYALLHGLLPAPLEIVLFVLLTVGAIAFYAGLSFIQFRAAGFEIASPLQFVSRKLVLLVAFEIFAVGMVLSRLYSPPFDGEVHLLERVVKFVGFLGSLLVAGAFFAIMLRLLKIGPGEYPTMTTGSFGQKVPAGPGHNKEGTP